MGVRHRDLELLRIEASASARRFSMRAFTSAESALSFFQASSARLRSTALVAKPRASFCSVLSAW